jgi:MFS family permease
VVGGVLVDRLGFVAALTVQAILLALASFVFVRTGPEIGLPEQGNETSGGPMRGFREVAAFLRHDRPLRALVLLSLVMVPFGMVHQRMMPVFVRDVLGGDATTAGAMVGLSSLGVGLAGIMMAAVGDRFHKGRVLLVSSGGFGCILLLFSFSRDVVLAGVLLLSLSFVVGMYLTLSTVLFQSEPPDWLRGRVSSVWCMVWGLARFADLAAGACAEKWGVAPTFAASGAVCLVFCIGMLLLGSGLSDL